MKIICTNCGSKIETVYGDGKFIIFPYNKGRLCRKCYKNYKLDLILLNSKYGLVKGDKEERFKKIIQVSELL